MDDDRMKGLVAEVRGTADAISSDIGWSAENAQRKGRR
jgi:hypothetical protein